MKRSVRESDYGRSDGRWLDIDWGEHLGQVEVDGASINFVDYGEGDGPPILLIHGLAGCWQNWLEQIPRFGDRHRVIALDLPGFGASPMPPFELGIRSYGVHVDRFCEALGFERGVVAGNSMGGFIAAEMAHASPHRVEKLVLVSPAGYSHAAEPRERLLRLARLAARVDPVTARLGSSGFRRPRFRHGTFRRVFHRPRRLAPEILWEMMAAGWGRPGFLAAIEGLLGYDIHDKLAEVRAPTLIVWGEEDRINPVRDADGFAELLPHARVVRMPRTGHCPMIERASRFNSLLEDFMAEAGGPPGGGSLPEGRESAD